MWNSATMTCLLTALAPSFGGDTTHMIFIESTPTSIVYATDSCILGLVLHSLTGDANGSMGRIAPPRRSGAS